MVDLIDQNANRILGLDGPTSDTKILSRSKQIINLLSIDEPVDYEIDRINLKINRTSTMINEAIQKLQNQRQKMVHNFFWFNFKTTIDSDVQKLLTKNDIQNAIRVWENAASSAESTRLHYKRNLGVLYLVALQKSFSEVHLRESIAVWKSILDNNNLMGYLMYDLFEIDQHKLSPTILSQFTSAVISDLSDIYTDMYVETEHPDFIKSYINIFKVKGPKLRKHVFEPSMEKLNFWATTFSALNVAEDKVLSHSERTQIKTTLENVKSEINYLRNLGLSEDSDVKVVRDQVGEGINRVCLDLHNHLDLTQYAIELITIAVEVAGTATLISKLEENFKTLQKEQKSMAIIQPIKELIEANKWEQAKIAARASLPSASEVDVSSVIYLFLRIAVIRLAQDCFSKSMEALDKKNFSSMVSHLKSMKDLLNENSDATELPHDNFNKLQSMIQVKGELIKFGGLQKLEEYRKELHKAFEGHKDETVGAYFIQMSDAILFHQAAVIIENNNRNKFHNNSANSSSTSTGCLGVFLVIVVVILFPLLVN